MSKNQNNSGPQKNNTMKPAKYGISDKPLKAYENGQVTDKPGQGQQMDKARPIGDSS